MVIYFVLKEKNNNNSVFILLRGKNTLYNEGKGKNVPCCIINFPLYF